MTNNEEAMLSGEHGVLAEIAMSILVKLEGMCNVDRMIKIENAHADASFHGTI